MWLIYKKEKPVEIPPEPKKRKRITKIADVGKGKVKIILKNKKIVYSQEFIGWGYWNGGLGYKRPYFLDIHHVRYSLSEFIKNINTSPVFAQVNETLYLRVKDIKSMEMIIESHIIDITQEMDIDETVSPHSEPYREELIKEKENA